jgi:hypothetical protein
MSNQQVSALWVAFLTLLILSAYTAIFVLAFKGGES